MGARILVADDSVTIQKVVELTFSREDFVLIPARSGEEAIQKAKEARPDLMLIDLVMPDKNGYEVCRALREDPLFKAIPIILLTGAFEAFDKAEGLKVGANDFVTKPFDSQALISKVKRFLSPVAAAPAPEPARPRPAPAPPGPLPALAASLAPPLAATPARAVEPAPKPVFELREEFPAKPPPAPAPAPMAPAAKGPSAAAPPPPRPAPVDLQELSLDDLTAEEPLGGLDISPIDLERIEPAVSGTAKVPAAPVAPPGPGVAPEPAAGLFELDLGPAPPETGPVMAEAPPAPAQAAPQGPELDLDLLGATPPAPLAEEPEPLDLGAPVAPLPAPAVLGADELLRELEMASTQPEMGGLLEPFDAPAAPPEPAPLAELAVLPLDLEPPPAPPRAETPMAMAPPVEAGIAPPPEPLAAPARPPEPLAAPARDVRPATLPAALSADDQAARLAAELAPYLAREIVDRIVERIERAVWEVVPDLAEALIARELDRIKERAEQGPAR